MFKKIPLTYFILNITACLTFFYLASGLKLVNLHKSSLYLGGTVALLLLYFLSGTFVEIRKKSRFKELVTSLNQSL
ncbi:MAG TPA: hypothetical protein VF273_01535, partial [Pelobium sp.]